MLRVTSRAMKRLRIIATRHMPKLLSVRESNAAQEKLIAPTEIAP